MICREAFAVEHLTVQYNGAQACPVIANFSMSFDASTVYALLGPNGCGKSTLLAAISGFLPLAGGSVTFYCGTGTPRGTVEYVPQDYRQALFPWRSVLKNVLSWDAADVTEARYQDAISTLRSLGIESYANVLPSRLSGGQQQLTVVARALLTNYPVLLLDEPLAALDSVRKLRAADLIREHSQVNGSSVICTLHDPLIAAEIADHVVILEGPPLRLRSVLVRGGGSGVESTQFASQITKELRALS